MAKMKRDERVCPFCAETIKASAIKCRFCQSDVTPVVEPDAAGPVVTPAKKTSSRKSLAKAMPAKTAAPAKKAAAARQAAATDTVADQASSTDEPDTSAVGETSTVGSAGAAVPFYKNLTLVLALLVALAGAGVGALWWQAEQGSSTSAPNGVLVSEDARTEVLITGADLAMRTLSYDYKTLDNDMEIARARMTKSFQKEYDATMEQVKANTEKNKIVLQAVAVSAAIISATEHDAKILVFLNQTTTAGVGDDAKQQANQNSLVVTLTRGDGDWAISKLTALG